MADIFLSYAKENRESARSIAALLESAGWTVWWDRRIPAGRTWRSVLEEALREMRCMVVLWSTDSIESDWVKEEAEEARTIRKLVPVLIDAVTPPVGFRSIQAADLTDWDGSNDAPGARQLIADLESLIGKPSHQPASESLQSGRIDRALTERDAEDDPGGSSSDARNRQSSDSEPFDESKSRERILDRKFVVNWKTAAAGAVGIALIVGSVLWLRRDETDFSQIPTANQLPPESVAAPRLVGVGVNAGRTEIKPREVLNLSLKAQYVDGTQNEIKEGVEWANSDPGVATVDADGRVTAHQAGRTRISGQYNGLVSPEWTLVVKAPEPLAQPPVAAKLVALAVSADKRELRIKEKTSLRVKAKYSDGSEKGLSNGIAWQSSDMTIASISPRGELEAFRAGTVQVVARTGGINSAPLNVVVKEPTLQPPIQNADAPSNISPSKPAGENMKIASYLNRAKDYRVQGNYGAALAELEKARATDPSNQEIRKEIEQTKRACNAEKRLGRPGLEC